MPEKNVYNFELEKAGSGRGGDRYFTPFGSGVWIIYVPQKISRPAGQPVKDLSITINTGGIDPQSKGM